MQKGVQPFVRKHSPLLVHRRNVTSQCGEDGLIAWIVEELRPAERVCVEFGAGDGKHLSNTYSLIRDAGWRGIMIEADGEQYRRLAETYAGSEAVVTVNRLVAVEGPDSLDGILAALGAPRRLGVISIDVDGMDWYIWESLERHDAELIVIEFNPTIPNDVIFVQEKSFAVNHGCSLLALIELGKRKGYELAVCTEWNALFVRREALSRLGIVDNFIGRLYRPLQDGRIFQGYDGSIHVVGMDRLLWKDQMPLDAEDFQVLPKALRTCREAESA